MAGTRVEELSAGDANVLREMAADVRRVLPNTANLRSEEIIDFLDAFGKNLADSPVLGKIEGATFLVFWLRRENLKRMLEQNLLGGIHALDDFCGSGADMMRAMPMGIVCHWVAGNIPTLALFSWALSLLTKNVALVRVSAGSIDTVNSLLEVLEKTESSIPASKILDSVKFVHFHRHDTDCHEAMSMVADCRIVWGGEESVRSVMMLPHSLHCNDVIFGPKYSLGVMDRGVSSSEADLGRFARLFCRDALVFDQAACSSPQTIFVERGTIDFEVVLDTFASEMERAARSNPKTVIGEYTAATIYATRAHWSMATDHWLRCSRSADWTICGDTAVSLKEAVQSRTLFLTLINDIDEVLPLLSSRIQTVGMAIHDHERALAFAAGAGLRGVSRCVRPGLMNVYDLPWDGHLVLNELMRWIAVKGLEPPKQPGESGLLPDNTSG